MSINWEELFERWEPLEMNGARVLIWDYREERSIAVIYRFVIGKDVGDEVFTIYIGSGDNLSGKGGSTSLVYQYQSGNRRETIRPKITEEIKKFKRCNAWTEIIELNGCLKNKRKIIENLAIVKYWLEYIKRLKNETKIPKFLNEKIERLGEITGLVRSLGFVE
jgi:hypothetical protein